MQSDVESIVRAVFRRSLPDTRIEKVCVVQDPEEGDGDTLRIKIVFSGDADQFNGDHMLAFIRALRSHLVEAQHAQFPLLSFVASKEANKIVLESV